MPINGRSRSFSLLLALLLLALPLAALAEEAEDEKLPEDYLDVSVHLDYERVSSPQISPDGSQIIYRRRRHCS